jgi:hypothetical protein
VTRRLALSHPKVPYRDPLGTSQTIAPEDRRSSDRDYPWRVNELAATIKVHRRTIERRISDGDAQGVQSRRRDPDRRRKRQGSV